MTSTDNTSKVENKTKLSTSTVLGLSGLAAIGAGTIYLIVQVIHPLDLVGSVSTSGWAITHYLSIFMDILSLLALAGLYAKHANKAGWLGLIGYLLFSLFWALSFAFHFIEAFIEPILVTEAPHVVAGLIGLVTHTPSEVSLGIFPTVYALAGFIGYALGGLLFGIAIIRARVFPRGAGILLAVGILLPLLTSSFVEHPYDRFFAVPVGLALIWLGYSLWSTRHTRVS